MTPRVQRSRRWKTEQQLLHAGRERSQLCNWVCPGLGCGLMDVAECSLEEAPSALSPNRKPIPLPSQAHHMCEGGSFNSTHSSNPKEAALSPVHSCGLKK